MVQLIENNVLYVLEESLEEIRKALLFYRKEQARHRLKAKKSYWREKGVDSPPPPRPPRQPKDVNAPKRPRGRPRKVSPPAEPEPPAEE
jgi:hypothetical protein